MSINSTNIHGIIAKALEASDESQNNFESATLEGDMDAECELFLSALESESGSPEEFCAIMEDHAYEMEMYQLITDADAALEAARNIVKLNKYAKFSAIQRRACVRLCKNANDPLYTKYELYRTKWREIRDRIYTKYNSKATRDAKLIIQNSRRKASGMSGDIGRSIIDKMDRVIAKAGDDR